MGSERTEKQRVVPISKFDAKHRKTSKHRGPEKDLFEMRTRFESDRDIAYIFAPKDGAKKSD